MGKIGVTASEIKGALAKKHHRDFFMSEVKSGSTWNTPVGNLMILDGLAIAKSWTNPCFTGYEIKISRSDFLRDAKFYTYEILVNCLYIVCPKGMIDRKEVPESVGLMYYDPEKKTITTKKKAIYRKIEYSADMLLYIIYCRLDSDRYPFHESREAYFREWVENKRSNKELGRAVRSKMVDELYRLERELEDVQAFREERQAFKDVIEVARKHGIFPGWHGRNIAEQLDEALKKKPVKDIQDLRIQLENVVRQMQAIEEKAEEETEE